MEKFCCRAQVALKQVVWEVIAVSSYSLTRDGGTDYKSASRPLSCQVGWICINSLKFIRGSELRLKGDNSLNCSTRTTSLGAGDWKLFIVTTW